MSTSRRTRQRSSLTWLTGVLAGSLLLAACGTDDSQEPTVDPGAEVGDETVEDETATPIGDGREISIGWIPWEEDIAVTNLWHAILEENGFEVTQTQADVAPVFDGVATGELDLFLDAWLPNTHEDYWDRYGEQVEDLGAWLDEAPLTWVVPAYVDEVDSIADLAANAELFDSRIVGIEAGSGLARISEDTVMPAYGLDGWDHVTGSTATMLAELERAIANEEPIVVTLWEPHPAYGQYDLKNLDDPETALGEPDEIRSIARQGFSDDFPEVAQAFSQWQFDAGTLADLEVAVLIDVEPGDELEGARTWLDANRDLVNGWLEGTDLSV